MKTELIVCVSTAEALKAAVQAGADAVRIGLKDFSAAGLPLEELKKAAVWCRVRGVRISASMEQAPSGRRFRAAVDAALELARTGVNALCVGDPGLLRALRLLLPDLTLEAAESLQITDAAGVRVLEALGARRLLLPPQLTSGEMRYLCRRSKLETEAVLCGRVCPALGPCRLSAFAGEGSGCGRECREHYVCLGLNAEKRPALKNILLADQLSELATMGLTALSIRCEGQKPECAAMTADIFHRALKEGKPPSRRDLQLLTRAFFSEGVSDDLYRGQPEEALLPAQTEWKLPSLTKNGVLGSIRTEAGGGEFQRVPVRITAELRRGAFSRILAADGEGNTAGATGPIPVNAGAGKRELTSALLRTQLFNTLGTPFLCTDAEALVDPGLYLGSADVGQMRREALNRLAEKRSEPPILRVNELPPLLRAEAAYPRPDLNFSVTRTAQLSDAMAALKPRVLYVPLAELLKEPVAVTPFWENGVTTVCAVLPERYSADEAAELFGRLKQLKELQITEVMVNSWNALLPAGMLGFRIRCGLGLQVWNDWSLQVLKELGAVSALLSPELTLEEIGAVAKCLDTELYAYGRLPLLTSEAPLTAPGAYSDTLRDRRGRQFPVLNTLGRSRVYSPDKLFLGDRLKDLEKLGLWCLHLAFTTENAGECLAAAERYLGRGGYQPNFRTKGMYYDNETHSGFRFPAKKGASGKAGGLRSDDPARRRGGPGPAGNGGQ